MKSSPGLGRAARFGAFEVDLRAGELRKHGIRIKLQDQPFQILVLLLAKPGEVVTREELRQKLWSADTFGDFDHGLNNAIRKLREALGDTADSPRYVETLPRRGYRLIVPVDETGQGVSPAPIAPEAGNRGGPETVAPRDAAAVTEPPQLKSGRRRPVWRYWIAPAAGAMVAAVLLLLATNPGGLRDRLWQRHSPVPIHSIAVLPLENLSGDPAQEFFADGMTDALITDLAKIGSLTVISRTSAMQYKGSKKKLPQVAQELHVDAFVEGTVVRSGKRVRIDAQLIQAATDRHVWANSYERDESDILALQNEVARAIANEIQISLTPQQQSRLSTGRAVNPEAYEEYLQGLYVFNKQVTPKTFTDAAEHFQKAIEKDPGYASAHAGLAASYAGLGLLGALSPRETNSKAKSAAERALAIDENLAEAHSALGLVLYYDWDWPGAEREFKRAMQANPSDVTAHMGYSWYLLTAGRFDQAIAEAEQAQQIDPLSLAANDNVANVLVEARQYDRALEKCRRILEMDPNFERAHFHLAGIYWRTGLYKEAVAEIPLAQFPRQSDRLALIYAESGDKPKGRKLLAQALQEKRNEGDLHETSFAMVYVALGDRDEALKWLEQAYKHHSYILCYLKIQLQWDPLRSDPRFQDLVRRMAFPQ